MNTPNICFNVAAACKRLVCLLGCISLFGCATIQETAESPETFAACKTVDIATTAAIINQGGF